MHGFCEREPNDVLLVSPHFPPSTLAGVHRVRHLAKHLPAHGWRPVVIRVDETHYAERPDPTLAALVPESVEQVRTAAVPTRLARLAGIGDIGLRGFFHLKRAIAMATARSRPGAVLITGSPYYPMLLARWIKRRLGVPVVLDFQDPWVSAEGATRPKWSKGGIAHQLAFALEPRAVRNADFITSVSECQNDQMASHYSWLDRTRMAAIPIGGDPDDFDALRAAPPPRPHVRLDPGQINLSYVGTFLPRAEPVVRALFDAVRLLKESQPVLSSKLRLHFVGTSNQPNDHQSYRIRPLAEEAGVADLVAETPQRVPFLEALHILATSHGLLLLGSDEPHYTASKIYPALMSGRPWLSIFHRSSSAHAILSAAGGGQAFAFDTQQEIEALAVPLADALKILALHPERLGTADHTVYSAYTAHSVAGDFARIFDRVAASPAL